MASFSGRWQIFGHRRSGAGALPLGHWITPAYEVASEHSPSLCSNPQLDASQRLRGRWRRKAAQVKASQYRLYRRDIIDGLFD
jgi:hypothetical protein